MPVKCGGWPTKRPPVSPTQQARLWGPKDGGWRKWSQPQGPCRGTSGRRGYIQPLCSKGRKPGAETPLSVDSTLVSRLTSHRPFAPVLAGKLEGKLEKRFDITRERNDGKAGSIPRSARHVPSPPPGPDTLCHCSAERETSRHRHACWRPPSNGGLGTQGGVKKESSPCAVTRMRGLIGARAGERCGREGRGRVWLVGGRRVGTYLGGRGSGWGWDVGQWCVRAGVTGPLL